MMRMAARNASASAMLRRLGNTAVRTRLLGDMTQEAVAEAAGISVQFLRKIERGTGNPSYLTLLAIAKALKIDLVDLIRDAR
jgi:transcriptional regulator with XRE-family HTH domain